MAPTYKYWKILHTPDTTESGHCMNVTYVRTEWKGFPAQQTHEKEILEDYCYQKFGPQVDYVMGVAPTLAWYVREISKSDYHQAEPLKTWMNLPHKIQLEIGDRLSNQKIKEIDSVDCLWRSDGERFTRNEDGTYSREKSKELQPTTFHRYSFKQLMDTGQFSVSPIE